MINDDAATNPHPNAAPMAPTLRPTVREVVEAGGLLAPGDHRRSWRMAILLAPRTRLEHLVRMAESVLATPSGETGSAEPVEVSLDALFRRIVAAMCGGWLCGLVVAGVLGRLVMRILASESTRRSKACSPTTKLPSATSPWAAPSRWRSPVPSAVRSPAWSISSRCVSCRHRRCSGRSSSRSSQRRSAAHSSCTPTTRSTTRGSIRSGSRVASFVALPALFGLVRTDRRRHSRRAGRLDRHQRTDRAGRHRRDRVVRSGGLHDRSGDRAGIPRPAHRVVASTVGEPVHDDRRCWLFLTVIVLGTLDLAVDISSIRAEEPRSCADLPRRLDPSPAWRY